MWWSVSNCGTMLSSWIIIWLGLMTTYSFFYCKWSLLLFAVECYPILPMYPPPLVQAPSVQQPVMPYQLPFLSSSSSKDQNERLLPNNNNQYSSNRNNNHKKYGYRKRPKHLGRIFHSAHTRKHDIQSIIVRFNRSSSESNSTHWSSKLFNHIHWLLATGRPALPTTFISTTESTISSSSHDISDSTESQTVQKRQKRYNRYYDIEALERWQDRSTRWFKRFWDRLFGDPDIDFENDYNKHRNHSSGRRINRSNKYGFADDSTLNRNIEMSPRLTVNDRFIDVDEDSLLDDRLIDDDGHRIGGRRFFNRNHSNNRANDDYEDLPGDDLYDQSRRRYLRRRSTLALPLVLISVLIVVACILMVLIEVKFNLLDSCLRVLDENNESANGIDEPDSDDDSEDDSNNDGDDRRHKRRRNRLKALKSKERKKSTSKSTKSKKKSHSSKHSHSSRRHSNHHNHQKSLSKKMDDDVSDSSLDSKDSDDGDLSLQARGEIDRTKLKRKRSKSKEIKLNPVSDDEEENEAGDIDEDLKTKKNQEEHRHKKKKSKTDDNDEDVDERRKRRSHRHRRSHHRNKKDQDEPNGEEDGEEKSDTGSVPSGTGTVTSVVSH